MSGLARAATIAVVACVGRAVASPFVGALQECDARRSDPASCSGAVPSQEEEAALLQSARAAHRRAPSLLESGRGLRALEAPDTLEACLRSEGGARHTYVGEGQYNAYDQTNGHYTFPDIHNARVTEEIRPSAVVFATQESHVVHAVSCAFRFNKTAYGRSGMNQYEASCVGTGADCVLIDVNNMWQIDWPASGCEGGAPGCVVPLGPGLSLGSAYIQLSERGYAIPAGTCAQVRVAGLTLGGGKGWLTRKYGLTFDRLRGLDVVLLNGTKVHANATSHSHLFWLARGAGGNVFPGIATAFHFELVPEPKSPATYQMQWPASYECRSSVFPQWYARMATNQDIDLWARIEQQNFGGKPGEGLLQISVVYIGEDKQLPKRLLDEVNWNSCGKGYMIDQTPNNEWTKIVLAANDNKPEIADPNTNNCGWDLSGDSPVRTPCYGYDTSYKVQWAYRSLIMGDGGHVPQEVWNALASDYMYNEYYVEIDPSSGSMSSVPSNATAYPYRGVGLVTLQQVMRGDADGGGVTNQMEQSAQLMREMTSYVKARSYYNYLDKNMNQYGAVPRDAYYGSNADQVEAYTREYSEGLPGGCSRCNSWELRRE